MKKYLIAIALLVSVAGKAQAEFGSGGLIPGSGADFVFALNAASASVATGGGVLDSICVATGTAAGYVVAFDTSILARNTYAADLLGNGSSLGLVIFSTSALALTSGGTMNAGGNCWNAPVRGARFANGLFIYNSLAGQSGDANKAWIYWRRD